MIAFISWYILITLLGWLSFPLVFRLFPALRDRGYTLARAAGMLIWAYVFWILATFGFVDNDVAGLILAFLVLVGFSLWAALGRRARLAAWIREHLRLILVSEVVFLVAFGLLTFIRSANPEIYGTEKPMELAFIDAILRSPAFPPRDPWLAGYAISYYHYGYIMTAMLARMTGLPGTVAFNMMLALIFGMGALGAYGVVYNLLAAYSGLRLNGTNEQAPDVGLPLLAPLFFLLVSNAEGFLEVLHRRGWFWRFNPDGTAYSGFWSWLDIKDLTQAPTLPVGFIPDRYLWWWRASRVVQDYDLAHNFQEVIDEFPAFSFVLGDLHPHVLAIPFGLLAVAFALNLYMGGLRGSTNLLGARLHISPLGFFSAAFLLGALAFLNFWDILMAAALIGLAYVLSRVRESGWNWERLEELLLLGIPLAVVAVLLYLPFFLSFSSQAGGILPNLVNPTRGAHLWVMFGTLLLPIGAVLMYAISTGRTTRCKLALAIAIGLPLVLWVLSWILAWLAALLLPQLAGQILASQGVPGIGSFFAVATLRRLGSVGGLLTLVAVLFLALIVLLNPPAEETGTAESEADPYDEQAVPRVLAPDPFRFVALLIGLGALLVIGPEFFYLRDQFGTRMNTVFKFYYQAWMLWSLSAAFAVAIVLPSMRRATHWLTGIGLLSLLLVVSLTYPALAFASKTNDFRPPFGFTLDDFDRLRRENPDEAGAISYLRTAPDGVVAEAIGGSYTAFARISTYTGLPTVLGWPGHEAQWRGSAAPQGTRQDDIAQLYSTNNWDIARAIIDRYHIRYIVVGALERQAYAVQEDKFRTHLPAVYQTGTISIYEVADSSQ